MAIEELKHFEKVKDIREYIIEGIKTGKLTVDEVVKVARIQARQGKLGEEVITKMANGLEETRNVVKLDKETGEPGWIVTNPSGEKYIMNDSTFKKKYERDPENPSQFKPKGDPVLSFAVNEHIEFNSHWGETMKLEAGGSLVASEPQKIYGIQKEEFKETYASTGKDKIECLKEAISFFEISQEEILEARQANEKDTQEKNTRMHTTIKKDAPTLE